MRLSASLALSLVAIVVAGTYAIGDAARSPSDLSEYREQKAAAASRSIGRLHAMPLSVQEAYGRIPHKWTPFRSELARMPSRDAVYLDALFALTDAAVVERVHVQSQMASGALEAIERSNYPAILDQLRSLSTPDSLLPIEALVAAAVQEQRRYFEEWRSRGDVPYFSPRAPLVQSSHRKLIEAYNRLMKMYPGEPAHNKQAFFDHLCALDFI